MSQFQLASGQHQPGIDKASACVVFVCNELCLILHNLCSGGHVTEGETEGERERQRDREREMKTKRRQRAFVFCSLPELCAPPEYFVNKLNPAPDHISFYVMWIWF